ncbi:MAG: EF-hand domain-containing protein [Defluviicoccus sp.]|nr:EF-hand domain-containing protein [Defluviicoccus sp.]MDE0384159.1 EF-hand domain-containing protein [Defluviicoccus sp.]
MTDPTKTLGAAALAALLAFGANGALAQSSGGDAGQEASRAGAEEKPTANRRATRFLRIFDTDGSGTVSLAEIGAEQQRLVAAADLDGDGTLSVDEFRRRGRLIRSVGATSLFDMLDTDGDRKVTAAEIAAPSARWFKRYDADGDGAIAAGELPQRRWHRGWRHGPRRK